MALLSAGCGTPPQLPQPAQKAPQAADHAKPSGELPTIPPGSVAFVLEEGGTASAHWRVPAISTPADTGMLQLIADLLRAARPAGAIPSMSLKPGALTILVPPPPDDVSWVVGFTQGGRVNVAPNVARCESSSGGGLICPPDAAFSVIGSAPARSPGLLAALRAATGHLALVAPVTVAPASVKPDQSMEVTGQGWIGPTVRLSLVWQQGTGAVRPVPVGTVAVHGGQFHWSGRVPGGLQTGVYALEVDGPARTADTLVRVR